MKQAILDTSFILTAIRNKIDFLDDMMVSGLTPILPKQVIGELKKITESKKKLRFKSEAKVALNLLKKKKLKKINLKSNYVDKGIIDYAKKHKNAVIATMDAGLKKKIKNQKLVVRAKKKLEILQ